VVRRWQSSPGGDTRSAAVGKVPRRVQGPTALRNRGGKTLLRYDNSHGVFEKHTEEGDTESVDLDYFEAYERFKEYVKEKEEVDRIW